MQDKPDSASVSISLLPATIDVPGSLLMAADPPAQWPTSYARKRNRSNRRSTPLSWMCQLATDLFSRANAGMCRPG
jgi:hypothetical protein